MNIWTKIKCFFGQHRFNAVAQIATTRYKFTLSECIHCGMGINDDRVYRP